MFLEICSKCEILLKCCPKCEKVRKGAQNAKYRSKLKKVLKRCSANRERPSFLAALDLLNFDIKLTSNANIEPVNPFALNRP